MVRKARQLGFRILPAALALASCAGAGTVTVDLPPLPDPVVREAPLPYRSDVVATYKARTDVQLDYHWGWKTPDLTQGLRACVTATHAQIIRQMIDDKDRLAALVVPAVPTVPVVPAAGPPAK
jgi:hypothetical protein